eukprot:GFUD01025915.1.p2 GENE.GFUD01025915.1~~GFUD01025915.1.p2  ORF type:complete len:128 (+),score=12.84 GFUD01025915.1:2642-3025(+)
MQKTSEDPYEEESRRGLLPGKGGVGHSSLQHEDLDAIKTEAGSVLLLARVRAGLPLSSFQAVPSTDVMDLALLLVSCSSAAADISHQQKGGTPPEPQYYDVDNTENCTSSISTYCTSSWYSAKTFLG